MYSLVITHSAVPKGKVAEEGDGGDGGDGDDGGDGSDGDGDGDGGGGDWKEGLPADMQYLPMQSHYHRCHCDSCFGTPFPRGIPPQ